MRWCCALLAGVAFTLLNTTVSHARGEHPLFQGVVQNCRGLSTSQCAQAKRMRIRKVTNTIRACERGIVRYCDMLLRIKDLSKRTRARVKRARARATRRGGGSEITQFLRRNTQEAPRGAYAIPQITARAGLPPGVSTGVPSNVTTGVPDNVRAGVPDNVRSGRPARAGVPNNVADASDRLTCNNCVHHIPCTTHRNRTCTCSAMRNGAVYLHPDLSQVAIYWDAAVSSDRRTVANRDCRLFLLLFGIRCSADIVTLRVAV